MAISLLSYRTETLPCPEVFSIIGLEMNGKIVDIHSYPLFA
jgi:hypothetical protein